MASGSSGHRVSFGGHEEKDPLSRETEVVTSQDTPFVARELADTCRTISSFRVSGRPGSVGTASILTLLAQGGASHVPIGISVRLSLFSLL